MTAENSDFLSGRSKTATVDLVVEGVKIASYGASRETIESNTIVVDISASFKNHKILFLDERLSSTGSCKSEITYIDGDKGILLYRGHPIEELAEQSTFMETSYLLIYGQLPSPAELRAFERKIVANMALEDEVLNEIERSGPKANGMRLLANAVNTLGDSHPCDKYGDPEYCAEAMIRIIAKMPMIIGAIIRHQKGWKPLKPLANLSYVENSLRAALADEDGNYTFNPVVTRDFDKLLMLHADHEQNASTTTARQVGSTGANPYATISSAINALRGPAHGGANVEVLEFLEALRSAENIPETLEAVEQKKFRIPGFGHAVYKIWDPRAQLIKPDCPQLLSALNLSDPKLNLALSLEEATLTHPYCQSKKLFPNIDFYSGIMFTAMGYPRDMLTALFAQARATGWLANWWEHVKSGERTLSRPRQKYVGELRRDYVPMNKRDPVAAECTALALPLPRTTLREAARLSC